MTNPLVSSRQEALSSSSSSSSSSEEDGFPQLPLCGAGVLQELADALDAYHRLAAEVLVLLIGEDQARYQACGYDGCSALFLDKAMLTAHESGHAMLMSELAMLRLLPA